MPKKSTTPAKKTKTTKNQSTTKTSAAKKPTKKVLAAKSESNATPELDNAANVPVRFEIQLAWLIVACAAAVLVLGGWLWWRYVYQNPERVFWGAIEQGLATPGVTKQTQRKGPSGQVQVTTQLALGSQNYARTLTAVTEAGPNNQQLSITTETLGTLAAQYVRYTDITTGTRSDGKKPDVSRIKNVWGKTDVDQRSKQSNRMLTEALVGVVPMANLTGAQRRDLMNIMRSKKVYDTNFTTKSGWEQGRRVKIYSVKVRPEAYASLMSSFVKQVGLGDIAALDPANYKNAPAVPIELSIDPVARQVVKVGYQDGSGRKEIYSNYGSLPNITLPSKTITIQELQKRTQQI